MNFNFSERMQSIRASEIRELLKLTEKPDIISFAGGLPAPELFPLKEIEEIASKVIIKQGQGALQYSTTEGYNLLRQIICEQRIKPGATKPTPDNILITSGSQQALDFTGKLFINKGDVIICESPSYLGAINAFKAYEPTFIEVPMDEDGIIIEKLEEILEKYPKAKFIYTIPDYQNPSGITLAVERRKKLVSLAEKYHIPIIEDSPYSELALEGEVYPSIKSFDKNGYVIQLGTFSKTFCPGFRIGWIYAEEEVLQKYILIKQGADLQCSTLDQRIVAHYMEKYCLDTHINKIIEVYKKRRNIMIDSMIKFFPKDIKFTHSKGGLFTWVELKEHMNSAELLKEALEVNVAFVPGASFFPNGGKHNYFRLNYSNMSEDKIAEGIERLGNLLKKYY
ncbi:PLP-dependent aminotransferase family protein [Clostridium polynesiense]|uniref:aminotransferase-like domain-containing protein n=1 Tax=Clostridium polynesiense TaxID=1325933 RepID=UPI0005910FDD|nr:PLP-dependent aminotransferase family protein [Clostridium polynesiense]